jgi:quercetin dioxygenase-like cupin family protein
MNNKHSLDPDDDANSRVVQDALLEALAPVPLSPEQASAVKLGLLGRIKASREAGKAFIHVRFEDGEWENLVPGVRVKRLAGNHRGVLLDLQPGTVIPFHRHHQDEECVVLRGEVQLGDMTVRAGDYHVATAGSRHGAVRSSSGALVYLRGTPIGHGMEVARDVLMGLLPGRGETPHTIHRDDGQWIDHAPGVHLKLLREDAHGRSLLLRLEPGTKADLKARPLTEECLVMDGEAFFGDQLMRQGDYRLAAARAVNPVLSSDIGSLLFLRSAAA